VRDDVIEGVAFDDVQTTQPRSPQNALMDAAELM